MTFFAGVAAFFYKCLKKPFSFKLPWKKEMKIAKHSNIPETIKTPEEREQALTLERESSSLHRTYEKALTEMAVGTMNMTTHHYMASTSKNASSNYPYKIKRLTYEIKQISTFLPIYYSNAIFVRYDDSKIDYMKALIMGAEETPYSHGAFLFDIYFDDTYPSTPPKVNLMTNGGGKLRFNPNLYNNGYVCLSLLGTWSGGKGETWTVNSNLLQVLLSIQSLVMTEGVLYNEPSYFSYKYVQANHVTILYKKQDVGYTNIVRYGNVKYAMNGMLTNPPAGFEDVIKKHFYYKKNDIMKTCNKWLEEAQSEKDMADYTSLVVSHNYELATMFNKNKEAYHTELAKEVDILRNKLNALNI